MVSQHFERRVSVFPACYSCGLLIIDNSIFFYLVGSGFKVNYSPLNFLWSCLIHFACAPPLPSPIICPNTWVYTCINFLRCRDGNLREGDQILAIDGQPLDSNISHQQAISILQKARGLVELVVAREAEEETQENQFPVARSPSAVSDSSKAGSDMVVSGTKLIFFFFKWNNLSII